MAAGTRSRAFPPAVDDAPKTGPSGACDVELRIRLSREDFQRLEQAAFATNYTPSRWVAALIHKALFGKTPPCAADRVNIANLVKALKRMETTIQKSSLKLARLEATTRQSLAPFHDMKQFGGQVCDMAAALDEVFKGDDAYWRSLIDEAPAKAGSRLKRPT